MSFLQGGQILLRGRLMSTLSKTLHTGSILIALILTPALVSAPLILPSSSDAHSALQKSYRHLARTLHDLRREEENLKMNRQLAFTDEKYLTLNPHSSTFRMSWGTALLKEGAFYPHALDKVPGGLVHISFKKPYPPCTIHLSNGVTICNKANHKASNTPIYLEQEDFQTILDFMDIGSKVIWEF